MEVFILREYRLVNKAIEVDLTDYEDIIKKTIATIVPDAAVTVLPDKYIIDSELSQKDTVKIGRALARTVLGQFCAAKYVLFKGKKINK